MKAIVTKKYTTSIKSFSSFFFLQNKATKKFDDVVGFYVQRTTGLLNEGPYGVVASFLVLACTWLT